MRIPLWLSVLALLLPAGPARAAYHYFNVTSGSSCILQDYRSVNLPPGIYDAEHEDNVTSSDGGSGYFYGGFVHHASDNYTLVQYVCWPAGGWSAPYCQQIPIFAGTNMTGYPQIGEGSSCAIKGSWPLFTTNLWTREATRYWQPANGTAHLGYQGEWIKEPVSGNWYHVATFLYPFAVTGVTGMSGWQEDYLGYTGIYTADYQNGYYYHGGQWNAANQIQFTPEQPSDCYLINNGTAAESQVANPGLTANAPITLTLTNQPALPTFDPILVTNYGASLVNTQLLVQWQVPLPSSPQLSYLVQVFTNSSYTGTPAVSFFDNAPDTRQTLLPIPAGITPYVSLVITDIFYNASSPLHFTGTTATPSPATNVTGTAGGLAFQYFESGASTWGSLPNFTTLPPVYTGAVNLPDPTPRRVRTNYGFTYNGYLTAPATGMYAFTLFSGDGAELIIDGTTVINFDGLHDWTQYQSGGIALAAGRHTFNVQYFKGAANAADDDGLGLYWQGPGVAYGNIPASAYSRVPGTNEPVITMATPTNGATIGSLNLALTANVTANGNTINNVMYYLTDFNSYYFRPTQGFDYYVGQSTTAPFAVNCPVWAAATNAVRARIYYNGTNIIDSAISFYATTNNTVGAWQLTGNAPQNYPAGGGIQGGNYTLIGDNVTLQTLAVNGNCTLTAHLASQTTGTGAPDLAPANSWMAGIIMRGTTNTNPGQPLGDSTSPHCYTAVFSESAGGGTYYEDDTMLGGNSAAIAKSSNLGNYKWFQIQRANNRFTLAVSPDGNTWSVVQTNTLTGMANQLYAGLFLNSVPSQNPNLNYATFDFVSLTGTNVLAPASLTVSPQTNAVIGGLPATFTAAVIGPVPANYQWQLNGTNIANATNASYSIVSATTGNAGGYTVVANSVTSAPAILVISAPAGSGVWTNGAGGSWAVSNNWSGGMIASGTDAVANFSTLNLSSNVTVTLDGSNTAGTLLFDDLNLTVQHNWTLGTGSGGPLTLAVSGGTPAIAVQQATNIISAVLAGTQGFTKTGPGYLTLNGSSTITGGLTVQAGTLEMQNKSGDTTYVVEPGATLKIGYTTGGGYANTAMTVNGSGTASTNGFYLAGGKTYNCAGTITLLGAPTVIRQYGSGTASLGTFDINSGQGLYCTASASGSIVASNVQMVSDGYGMIGYVDPGTNTANGDLTLNGPLNVGSSGFFKRGGGSLLLNGAATTGNASVQIAGGTILCGVTNCLGVNASVPVSSGATLALNGFNQTVASLNAAGGSTVDTGAGTLTVNSSPTLAGALAVAVNKGGTPAVGQLAVPGGTLTAGGSLTVYSVGSALAAGDSFTLFTSASLAGGFTNVTLPALPFWLMWNTNNLAAAGQIIVTNSPADVWTGGSLSSGNWSDAANWGGTAPNTTGDNLVLTGSARPLNTNDWVTAAGWLQINPGVPFTISGNALTLTAGLINSAQSNTLNLPVTLGASQTISVAAGTSLTVSNLLFGGNYTATASGGGTLVLNGSAVNLAGQGATAFVATNLGGFIYTNTSGTLNFTVATSGTTTVNQLGTNVTVTAATFGVGNGGPAGSATAQTDWLYLGQTNIIHAGTINVGDNGAATGNAYLRFGSGLTNPSLVIRGAAGGTNRATLNVGVVNSSDYASGQGTLDLTAGATGGTLDAMLGTVTIGYRTAGAGNYANSGTGTLTFGAGTLDATNVILGQADTKGKSGTGILNANGGTLKVLTLILGNQTAAVSAGAVSASGTVNANAGSLIAAALIRPGTGAGSTTTNVRAIYLNGATLANYDTNTDLLVSNLTVTLSGGYTNWLQPGTGRNLILTNNAALAGSGGFLLTGGGKVRLWGTNTYAGGTYLSNGTLALSGYGSVSNTPLISVGAGAMLDVSGLNSTFNLGSGQILSNNAAGTGTVKGNLNTGSGNVSISYQNGTPAFNITNGTLTLAAATGFQINNTGAALVAGSYRLIATNLGGIITGTLPATVAVGGNGLTAGTTDSLQLTAGGLNLVVTATVNTAPTNLTASVTGNVLTLGWPADHTGWRLLVQTNHLTTGVSANPGDWGVVSNSATTNQVALPINPALPAQFYQLVYP